MDNMAFLFKPPEQRKRNERSPKLSLPTMLVNNSSSSVECQVSGSQSSPIAFSSSTGPKHQRQTLRMSSSFSQSTCSPISTTLDSSRLDTGSSPSSPPATAAFKRPAPPSMLTCAILNSDHNTNQLVGRISSIQQDHDFADRKVYATEVSPVASVSSGQIHQLPYTSNDHSRSIESYPLAGVATHDSVSSASYLPSPKKLSAEVLPGSSPSSNTDKQDIKVASPLVETKKFNDVDELEEEMWTHFHLKDQIEELGILGEGAGGSVVKCKLKTGTKIFALKAITTLNSDQESQKQIFRELQFNKSCKSSFIVQYYGMFTDQEHSSIYIAMEYMGGKSLDAIYKHLLKYGGRVSEKVLGKIAESVLRGLSYLHERKIIHRDIKPQNVLLNEAGEVKLCDFGVSGEAVNSLATTFTGTSYYMAPERIQGQPYSVTSDVWSLGLTLLEVAQAHFPFDSGKMAANMPPIELLMLILTFTPQLKDEPESNIAWSKAFKSFIEFCLKKESRERPSPRQMLQHPWIQGQLKRQVNMAKFIQKCWAVK
ncbi:mitogen-activated protein kinase kinase MKK1 Ecym_8337 [Eremothecium cymbalariae DBVPG|uniref:mitogen-activated protein kinase kinase n=1 Tax=Eremothecium cymbalariae (strain CBS 270.75 / DBVPG 7215 / KCTC 17166 / NRRL Y-17582) TaxID=931890 RepID=G8JXP1_ERECY|nr:Hypothetical protein Ecym_8337 [Eremothecium cymbalariae DBVPG\